MRSEGAKSSTKQYLLVNEAGQPVRKTLARGNTGVGVVWANLKHKHPPSTCTI